MTTHFRWIVFALVAAALVAGCDSSRSPVSNSPKVKPTVGDERTGSSVAAADADRTPTTSPEVERTADSVPLAPATEPLDGYVLIAPLRSRNLPVE